MSDDFLRLSNLDCAPLGDLPQLDKEVFRTRVIGAVNAGNCRVPALFMHEDLLIAVLADDESGKLLFTSCRPGGEYKSLTPECPAFHWFEREIFEENAVKPVGHPWLKPIRFPQGDIGIADYYRIAGDAVHEVAVGPVHAGVIEPGHFRFQCTGEKVHHLEISLGYQHRGIERMLKGGPDRRTIHLIETASGDSSAAAAGVYSMIIESLTGRRASEQGEAVRLLTWEIERAANHLGDLGALAGDTGFLPGAAACAFLRGELLNLIGLLCGNRFSRGLIRPGGTAYPIDRQTIESISERLARLEPKINEALNLLFGSKATLKHFRHTGIVNAEDARRIGMVGVAGRASGASADVRISHPCGGYRNLTVKRASATSGDALARAEIRRQELLESLKLLHGVLAEFPEAEQPAATGDLAGNMICAGLVEAWRGELCHVAITAEDGRLARYKIVDPSFHNWFGLALALRGEQISNFPICNKSFNLSYCGHDL